MRLRVSPSCFLLVGDRRAGAVFIMGLIPTLGMGCALQNAVAEEELDPSGIFGLSGSMLGRFCTCLREV